MMTGPIWWFFDGTQVHRFGTYDSEKNEALLQTLTEETEETQETTEKLPEWKSNE